MNLAWTSCSSREVLLSTIGQPRVDPETQAGAEVVLVDEAQLVLQNKTNVQ